MAVLKATLASVPYRMEGAVHGWARLQPSHCRHPGDGLAAFVMSQLIKALQIILSICLGSRILSCPILKCYPPSITAWSPVISIQYASDTSDRGIDYILSILTAVKKRNSKLCPGHFCLLIVPQRRLAVKSQVDLWSDEWELTEAPGTRVCHLSLTEWWASFVFSFMPTLVLLHWHHAVCAISRIFGRVGRWISAQVVTPWHQNTQVDLWCSMHSGWCRASRKSWFVLPHASDVPCV